MMLQLIQKELALQREPIRFALVIAVLSLLSLLLVLFPDAMWIPRVENADTAVFLLFATITPFSLLLFPLVTGVTAIVEERSTGAFEWQLSAPVSRAKQWVVKMGVVYLLTILVGMLLPLTVHGIVSFMLKGYELTVSISPVLRIRGIWPGVYALLFASAALYGASLARVPLVGFLLGIGLVILLFASQTFSDPDHKLLLLQSGSDFLNPLAHYVLIFAMAGTVSFLAFWNFRLQGLSGKRLFIHVLIWLIFINALVFVVYPLETGRMARFHIPGITND